MGIVSRPRPPVKVPIPPPQWLWIQAPLWPSPVVPMGLPGMILINQVPYMVTVLAEGPGEACGFRLTKDSGELYDLPADLASCDCGDGTFRPERPLGCKHARALREALNRIGYPAPEPVRRPAFTRQELDDAGEVLAMKWGGRFAGDDGPRAA